jgi:hypothetical protein
MKGPRSFRTLHELAEYLLEVGEPLKNLPNADLDALVSGSKQDNGTDDFKSGEKPTSADIENLAKEAKERAAFEADLAHYRNNQEAFVREYSGRWIAIINRTVVDTDTDFSPLAKRVYERYGYRAILMTKVEAKPRTINIPSPRLARS